MKFTVSISNEASFLLSPTFQQKLARRAARKALRMGKTSAIVIFSGPNNLRVVVNCQTATIIVSLAHERVLGPTIRLMRRSA